MRDDIVASSQLLDATSPGDEPLETQQKKRSCPGRELYQKWPRRLSLSPRNWMWISLSCQPTGAKGLSVHLWNASLCGARSTTCRTKLIDSDEHPSQSSGAPILDLGPIADDLAFQSTHLPRESQIILRLQLESNRRLFILLLNLDSSLSRIAI